MSVKSIAKATGLIIFISVCTLFNTPLPATPVPATVFPTLIARSSATLTPTSTDAPLLPTATREPTETPFPTATSAPTITPTYAVLRAEVLQRANCRYGPGWPYLYKYGLLKGNNIEVIGRIEYSNWVYIQAIDGNNPCWVRADLLDIKGDIMSLEPLYPEKAKLPGSPYYPPTTVLDATREGNTIHIHWLEVPVSVGDLEDENMQQYIIEIWHCHDEQFVFEPLATNYPEISFIDEPGCSQASHGRVFVQEKHGFAGPAEIPWPSYGSP